MKFFFNNLLLRYSQKKISVSALVDIFESESYQSGLTGLQWLLAQKKPKLNRVVFGMLSDLEKQGIFTSAQLLKLITQPNAFGRSAYFYALRGLGRSSYTKIAAVVYHAFKENRISAETFHGVLAHKDKKGVSILVQALHFCPLAILRFYFYQWENSLGGDQRAYERFALALTEAYSLKTNDQQSSHRTPFSDAVESGELERLNLYLKKLRFCFIKRALTKEDYFKTLIPRDAQGRTMLQSLAFKGQPELLERYLQELLYCAKESLASYPELSELFLPLALNPEVYKNRPEKMEFANEQVASCFARILQFAQANQLVVASLPGLESLNRALARYKHTEFTSYFCKSPASTIRQNPYFYSFFEQQQLLKESAKVKVYEPGLEFQPR